MKKISLVNRIGSGIKAFSAGFGAGISTFQPYEGAGFSRKRPVIYGAYAQDSQKDLSKTTRTELLKLARHMYRNVGLVKGAVDSVAQYSIGSGLRPQYRGEDQEFGKLAESYWRDVIAPCPEITGRMSWADLLMALSRSIDIDGDVFVMMTKDGMLQVVEGHRVCEGADYATTDGVFLGKFGEPTGYLVELDNEYRRVNCDNVIHLMEIERPDQVRGASALARALNHLRDLKLITEFEKDALKVQSSIAAVITSENGDPLANSGGFFGKIEARDATNDVAREEITSSANIPRLLPGEKIENLAPTRPGSSFEPFAKYLIRDIALGLNLPPEFVYDPAAVGGAGMRFIVAKAQRRFEQRQRLLIDRFCQRAWRFFIARAIAKGDLPAAKDYDRISWQTPKSLTVDAGREAMQAREDYKAGLSTLADYFGELGLDWQEQVDQRKAEEIYVSGGAGTRPDALITKIGAGAASSLLGILQSVAAGQISKEQAITILVSVYGLTEEDAGKIANQAPILETKNQATIDQKIDPAELSQPVTKSASIHAPVQMAPHHAETFTMKDDPDFQLSEKELNMVAKAVGLKNKPIKKKKAN
jgi:lambda family phage portal protein